MQYPKEIENDHNVKSRVNKLKHKLKLVKTKHTRQRRRNNQPISLISLNSKSESKKNFFEKTKESDPLSFAIRRQKTVQYNRRLTLKKVSNTLQKSILDKAMHTTGLNKKEKKKVLALKSGTHLTPNEERIYFASKLKKYPFGNKRDLGYYRVNTLISFAKQKKFNKDLVSQRIFRNHKIDGRDDKGNTPLYYSAMYKNILYSEFLIENGADINMICEGGNTPFHKACQSNNCKLINLFMINGGDPRIMNDQGFTPFGFLKKHTSRILGVNKLYISYKERV